MQGSKRERGCHLVLELYLIQQTRRWKKKWFLHHKLHGSQFSNNNCAKFSFHRFIWIDMDVIHLFVLFEHRCHVHCLYMNVICLFVLFWHECCVSIHIVYTQKLCKQRWLLCLNNVWHSCVKNMNPWNNRFHTNLERTHEAYKFVMWIPRCEKFMLDQGGNGNGQGKKGQA
jgi:hypothetical protein